MGRLIRTDHPDGSYSRLHFTPWQQVVYDRNDTVGEAGNKWHADMSGGTTEEADAAAKALAHADTPTTTYFDGLGRPVVVVEDNGTVTEDNSTVTYTTRSVLDIRGNLQKLIDAKDRACMTYTHGMLGQVLKQTSIDAGTRWMFGTAAGEPVKSWGERGFTHTAKYDECSAHARS